MFRQNLVFAYVILVGLPLVGFFGILELGRTLTSPPALAGDWTIEPDRNGQTSTACAGPFAGARAMTVSQSGANLVIRFNDTRKTSLQAFVEHNTLIRSVVFPMGSGTAGDGCGDSKAVHLSATVTGTRERRVLQGTILADGCSSCAPFSFRATRLAGRAGH